MSELFGKLYIVATPIGNLKDITLRAIETLESVDIIACEDTRRTVKLLNHLNIKKKMISYFEHNKIERGEYLISLIKEGQNIALVSDAGTPAISDPGEELVRLAIENKIDIIPILGATALIGAIVASGFSTGRFVFEGFLPTNKRSKRERIEEIRNEKRTIILYEAPHKLLGTLRLLMEILGDRKIVLARELTKIYEEFWRTTLKEALEKFENISPKGEYVLAIEGTTIDELEKAETSATRSLYENMSIKEQIEHHIEKGLERKIAIKQVAKERNMGKREVYMHYILIE